MMLSSRIYVIDFQEYKKKISELQSSSDWDSKSLYSTSLFLLQGYTLESNVPTQAYQKIGLIIQASFLPCFCCCC